jgi:acyl-CoA thioesterase FadM
MTNRPFRASHRARFNESDPAGILFFNEAFKIAHGAYEDFVQELGFTWDEWFKSSEWGVPIRHSECEHKGAIYPGSIVFTDVHLEELGESSFKIKYSLSSIGSFKKVLGASAPILCAEVRLVHMFVGNSDPESLRLKKIPIPSRIRERLKAYQMECLTSK